MLRRPLWTASLLALPLLATTAHAALRSPQVPVSGTALQAFFTSQGQAIDAGTDQLDLQTLSAPVSTGIEVRVFGPDDMRTFGAYNASPVAPQLYMIYPGATTPGWYQVFSFRSAPDRLVVSLFDALNTFQGSTTYIGGPPDHTFFGFYDRAPGIDIYYTQDVRNPGGAARILAYNGTGARTGWTWFACETGAGPGGDYADLIAAVNLSLVPVPVLRSRWGTVKRRFR